MRIFDYLTAQEKCAASRTCRKYNRLAEISLLRAARKQFETIGLFEGFNGQKLFQSLSTVRYWRIQLRASSKSPSAYGCLRAHNFTDLRETKPGALLIIHNLKIENRLLDFKVENLISDQPALMAFVNTHDVRYETFTDSGWSYHEIKKNKCVILTPNTFSSFSEYCGGNKLLGLSLLAFRLEGTVSPLHIDYFRRLITGMPCGQIHEAKEEVRTTKKRRFWCCSERKVSVVALETPIEIEKLKTE